MKASVGAVVGWALVILATPWLGMGASDGSATAAGYCAANMVLAPFIAFAVIALQQLAVMGTAHLLGDRSGSLTIGIGPRLFGRTIRWCQVSVHLVPLVGTGLIATTRARGQRARLLLATAAGVAVPVGLLAAICAAAPGPWSVGKDELGSQLAFGALAFLASGVAVMFAAPRFLSVLGAKPSALAGNRRAGSLLEAALAIDRGAYTEAIAAVRRGLELAPDDLALQAQLAVASSCARADGAFDLTTALLQRELPAEIRPICLNLRAWECYLRGTDDLRAEADRASQEALAAHPDHPAYLDTRGHVLLWLGSHAEAERNLARAYERASERRTRASSAAGLAILCAANERAADAARWLAHARTSDEHHPLLARAIAAVEPLRRT